MDAKHLSLLTETLGASKKTPNGYKNRMVVSAVSEAGQNCLQLVAMGLMGRIEDTSIEAGLDDDFFVTARGASLVRHELMEQIFTELLDDRVNDAASLAASERVGPNSIEYDGLCDSLSNDPVIIGDATREMLKDLFFLCADLKTQLSEATQMASDNRPDDFPNWVEANFYTQALLEHSQVLEKSEKLIGNVAWMSLNQQIPCSPNGVTLSLNSGGGDNVENFEAPSF